jgi:phosphohistidine phosphatase
MSTSKKATAAPPPEQFLIFLRHGIAEDPTAEQKDEDRSLTAEGHAQMKQIARGLEVAMPKPPVIYSSPLLRAMQTALWVSRSYRQRANVSTTDALKPEATKKEFLALLKSIEHRRILFVGHEPSITANVRALVGYDVPGLKKGACYGVRVLADGTAELEWLLTPRILRKLGETAG